MSAHRRAHDERQQKGQGQARGTRGERQLSHIPILPFTYFIYLDPAEKRRPLRPQPPAHIAKKSMRPDKHAAFPAFQRTMKRGFRTNEKDPLNGSISFKLSKNRAIYEICQQNVTFVDLNVANSIIAHRRRRKSARRKRVMRATSPCRVSQSAQRNARAPSPAGAASPWRNRLECTGFRTAIAPAHGDRPTRRTTTHEKKGLRPVPEPQACLIRFALRLALLATRERNRTRRCHRSAGESRSARDACSGSRVVTGGSQGRLVL